MGIGSVLRSLIEGTGDPVPGAWSGMPSDIDSYDPAQRVLPNDYGAWMATAGIPVADPGSPLSLVMGRQDVAAIWKAQPNVRKTVNFIASNLATVPLHLYDRVSDAERQRVTDDPVARVLREPVPGRRGAFRHWHSTLSDWMLYDRWLNVPIIEDGVLVRLEYIPAWRTKFVTNQANDVQRILFWAGDSAGRGADSWLEIDPDAAIWDHGYAPNAAGASPIETLRDMLAEQAESVAYRRQVWKQGFHGNLYISRPAEAPPWAKGARERFTAGIRAYLNGGTSAGALPLLEDGMRLEQNPSALLKDTQDLEGRKLAAVEVATLWGIPPEMLGDRPSNYSNMDAFRQMLYRDHLGSYIVAWEQALRTQLLARVGRGNGTLYIEANVDSKLRGSFETRGQTMQMASGGPWRTLNEVRALDNLPPVEDGDTVLRPLNMGQATQGGTDSGPVDGVTPNQRARMGKGPRRAHRKDRAPDELDDEAAGRLVKFFRRQGAAVTSRAAAGADWWDTERWDAELSEDLTALGLEAATAAARSTLTSAGLDPDAYDVARTVAYLTEAARRNAATINKATRDKVAEAIADDEATDEDGEPLDIGGRVGTVYADAETNRAAKIAIGTVTFASAFGAVESAKQRGAGTKTWRVNSGSPRPSHAAMDGETVGLDDDFSNGLPWPGAAGSDADEAAGCQCSIDISYGD